MEESNVIFRHTPPPVEVNTETLIKDRSGIEAPLVQEVKPLDPPPLSIYQKVRGKPYSVDYFELGSEWEFANHPNEIATIEGFVEQEIYSKGMTNTVDSYKEIVDSLKAKIGVSDNEKTWRMLDRLTLYIKTVQNYRKWEERKRQLEYGTTP